jgi:hypothetical protein
MAADGAMTSAHQRGTDGFIANALEGASRRDETILLRKVVAACGHLSALAGQDIDVSEITDFLAVRLGCGVVLLDRGLEALARAGSSTAHTDLVELLREHGGSGLHTVLAAAARNRRALTVPMLAADNTSLIVAPVLVSNDVTGYLLADYARDDELAEDLRLLVTEHAAMVCGVVLGRDLVVAAVSGRARQELIEALLQARYSNDGEAERWARHLGYDPAQSHHVLALAAPGTHTGTALSATAALLTRLAPDAIVTVRADEVVAIVPIRSEGVQHTERQVRELAGRGVNELAARTPGTPAAGIGNPFQAASGISRSYAEATRALASALRATNTGGVTAFAELGIHRLLLRVPEVNDVRAFAEEVLGKLLVEEQSSGMEYLKTLTVYFDENSSPRRTAERLHVHPNTVNYRIHRIEEITELSFDVHRDRLMAEVAVEIINGLGKR